MRNSGLSAVIIIRGTLLISASITAGKKLAAAVPDVQIKTTGLCVDFAIPSAKKAAPLSSIWLLHSNPSILMKAAVSGEFLAPGEMQACRTPKL